MATALAVSPQADPQAAPAKKRRSGGISRENASAWWAILAWIIALIYFFPVLYMLLTSFKTEAAAVQLPPKLIFMPTLENYRAVFSINFGPFFRNSLIASLGSTLIVMILAIPAAYGLAFHPSPKWKNILFFFISTKFMPPAGIIVPLYILYSKNGDPWLLNGFSLGLLGTMRGLMLLYVAMNMPIAIWMLRSFFVEVPKDVIDASRVDGANVFQQMTQIVVPMVGPGLAATVFLAIIFAWNEFFFAFNLTNAGNSTVPIFMLRFVTSEGLFWAKLAASSTMAVLPIVILGWIAQKQLVRGLSMGAVK
ncbi:MAG: carbohydrate ABC transporter permease [Thermomicrobiales bacterium]